MVQLSFGGTGNNLAHNLTKYMDGSIVGWCGISGCGRGVGLGAEEGVSSGEVGGIAMHP